MLSKPIIFIFLASVAFEIASAKSKCVFPKVVWPDRWALSVWNQTCVTHSPVYTWSDPLAATDCAKAPCYNFDAKLHVNDHLAAFAFTSAPGKPERYLSLHGEAGCSARSHLGDFYDSLDTGTGAAGHKASSFKVCAAKF
ncbi:hypothetical protein BJ138DRAFT_1140668 [Hygrophoropsis aurantiaca]|uniref:Uncharacterized protein n=1 Tax=Hygrophoropsis aurantiaca TaxID=72124 RepID=A0ACB8AQT4_9AGAM|nr:hypothetical protein BJ138DRAFT_1140668 [Hygrophoropsis aurantiaca]